MSRSWFPDILGPSAVGVNGGSTVGVRKQRLNILSSGVTAVDNAAARRVDVAIPDPAWNVANATLILGGEQYPSDTDYVLADLVRVDASFGGTSLVGLDSGTDPTRLVKYIANIGGLSVSLKPPTSPSPGGMYFSGAAYTLTPNSTVRAVWDTVSRVYRVKGAAVVTDHILLGSNTLALGSSQLANPL